MINSKRALMRKLASDKTSLEFITRYNWCGKNVGDVRQVERVQTNAFTLLSNREGKMVESWIYPYEKDIEVKNNHIYYYKHNDEHIDDNIEIDIEIIERPEMY